MKKIWNIFCITLLSIHTMHADDGQHVILISIDGLRPEFYKDPSWNMVHLRQAMAGGVYADGVDGVFPSVTYPSHTSIITGVKPIKHGIYYNTLIEPDSVTGRWFWYYDTIKVPTIFSKAKEKGLITASVFWPVSVGSPATYNIPEYWYLPAQKGGERSITKALSEHAQPKGLYEELKNNAIGQLEEEDFDGNYLASDEHLARMGCYLIRKYKPSFLALHLIAVDHFAHEQGRDGDKVRAAVASVDHALKTIMEAVEKAGIKDKTTFIITGDHGFVDIHSTLAPNVLLANAGLYEPYNKTKTKAYFHTAGGSAFLHLSDKKDLKTLQEVTKLLQQLPAGQRKMFAIKDRTALDEVGADPNAALGLAPQQGYTFSAASSGNFVRPGKGGTHGFFPDFKEIQTGFVAFGNGIKKGVVIPNMGLVDIAPLVAELLQLGTWEVDGTLYRGILKEQNTANN